MGAVLVMDVLFMVSRYEYYGEILDYLVKRRVVLK